MCEPDKCGAPPSQTKRVASINENASKRIGDLGDPMSPLKIKKSKGIHGLYGTHENLAQCSWQENRKGSVIGIYVKRPGLENPLNAIAQQSFSESMKNIFDQKLPWKFVQ